GPVADEPEADDDPGQAALEQQPGAQREQHRGGQREDEAHGSSLRRVHGAPNSGSRSPKATSRSSTMPMTTWATPMSKNSAVFRWDAPSGPTWRSNVACSIIWRPNTRGTRPVSVAVAIPLPRSVHGRTGIVDRTSSMPPAT